MRDVVRAYPYTASLPAPPTEVLLVPFAKNGKLVGTVWIVAHDPGHTFDREDLRVVASLAVFASAVSATVSVVRNLAARESERDQNAQAISRELQDARLLRDVAFSPRAASLPTC
jgi:transcriptional regulator with GAF, ATPase, and Fis domain